MAARKPSTVHHYSGTGVVGDGFGYVDGGVFATHIIGADFAFGDDASDGGFQARGHLGFLEPVAELKC